jgi:hypothetical protein
MQIDPKVSMWIMIAMAVMGVLAASGAQLTELFGTGVAQKIVTADGLTLAIVGAVAGVLHGYSSPVPGPLVNPPLLPPVPNPREPLKIVLLALAVSALMLLGGDAFAQSRKAPPDGAFPSVFQPPAPPQRNPLDELAQKIARLSLDDFKYAAALAHATNNTVTMACWDEWVKLISSQQAPLKDPQGNDLTEPPVHIATDIERLSEMIRQMQPNSELSVACAPMAQAAQKDVGVLIGAVLSGGAMGLFKLPFAIP